MLSALRVGILFPFLVQVLFAHETYLMETKVNRPVLPGFVGFHTDAKKAISGRGRASAGLSSFFNESFFSNGKQKEEPSPLMWVLPV